MSKTYKFVKKNKNVNQAIILKSGLEAEVTIAELAQDVRGWVKTKIEMMSLSGIAKAMMINIERNYPMVMKLNDEQLETIAVYNQKKKQIEAAKKNLKMLDANYKSYGTEFKDIKKSLAINEDTELDMALVEYRDAKDIAGDALRKGLKNA